MYFGADMVVPDPLSDFISDVTETMASPVPEPRDRGAHRHRRDQPRSPSGWRKIAWRIAIGYETGYSSRSGTAGEHGEGRYVMIVHFPFNRFNADPLCMAI